MKPKIISGLRSLPLILFLLLCGAVWAAEPVMKAYDRNRDGKMDYWDWILDDHVTSETRDNNYDGVVDYKMLRASETDKYPETWWADNDFDGEYDMMCICYGEQLVERWTRDSRSPNGFYYNKRDDKDRLITSGVAAALGDRNLESVKTSIIREVDVAPQRDVWLRSHADVRLSYHGKVARMRKFTGDEPGDKYSMTIHMQDSASTLPLPLEINVRELDVGTTRHTELHDENGDRLYERVIVREYPEWKSNDFWGPCIGLYVLDRNHDGRFDLFSYSRDSKIDRMATDDDFDGLLDTVEYRSSAPGGPRKVTGDAIGNRALPVVPIPYERINALLERAAEIPEAEEQMRAAKESRERNHDYMLEARRALMNK